MARILIADDEEIILHTFSKMLSRSGFDVSTAATDEELMKFIDKFADNSDMFDVIILDYYFSNIKKSEEYLGFIRNLDPNVKVLLSTGDCTINHKGFDGLIQKPCSIDELAEKVSNVIK